MPTFAGEFRDPTEDWVVEGPNEHGKYWIGVKTFCECGAPCCRRPQTGTRPHTSQAEFDEHEDAVEYIEMQSERINEQYDDYLEENRHSILQMERYEMWRREY